MKRTGEKLGEGEQTANVAETGCIALDTDRRKVARTAISIYGEVEGIEMWNATDSKMNHQSIDYQFAAVWTIHSVGRWISDGLPP